MTHIILWRPIFPSLFWKIWKFLSLFWESWKCPGHFNSIQYSLTLLLQSFFYEFQHSEVSKETFIISQDSIQRSPSPCSLDPLCYKVSLQRAKALSWVKRASPRDEGYWSSITSLLGFQVTPYKLCTRGLLSALGLTGQVEVYFRCKNTSVPLSGSFLTHLLSSDLADWDIGICNWAELLFLSSHHIYFF